MTGTGTAIRPLALTKDTNDHVEIAVSDPLRRGAAVGLPQLLRRTCDGPDSAISEIIVYGTDPCPRSTDDEVVGVRP